MTTRPSHFRITACSVLLISVSTLAACATPSQPVPRISLDEAPPARLAPPERPQSVEVVAIPEPLPLPGQLRAVNAAPAVPEPGDPRERVGTANAAARIEPVRDGFINAMQLYPWTEGALYQVYTAPGQVTDIALQEGEQLAGSGPVAAGDTARWIIGDTVSGAGDTARVHILIKPTRADLTTNLVINTDRRTYHLELRATPATYMASVSWRYPRDELLALRARNQSAAAAAPIAAGVDIAALNFRYAIGGDDPPWRPLRAFDDGAKVYIEFPRQIGRGDMPPLFVVGAGSDGELVNYRVSGRHMIVDRLFAAAELRLGDKHTEQRVRITRSDGRRRR